VGFNLRSNSWNVPKASSFDDFSKNCNRIDPTQNWRVLLASFHELESLSCNSNRPVPEFDCGCDGGLQFTFECLKRSKVELVC
jgi:hypothetical protein